MEAALLHKEHLGTSRNIWEHLGTSWNQSYMSDWMGWDWITETLNH